MAQVVITLKIMPTSPEVDLPNLEEEVMNKVTEFTGEKQYKVQVVPVAFGLKALNIIFVMDEKKGSTEPLEDAISKIGGVNSVEVTDVRRAVG